MKIRRLLAAHGIHYLATRFGSSKLRAMAFDEKYARGDWNFNNDGDELPEILRKYLGQGHLLLLGCGSAAVVRSFRPEEFTGVVGVDLSRHAIELANCFVSPKVRFVVGDMTKFTASQAYDVILFSESLNYVPLKDLQGFLKRLQSNLKPDGKFVVTFAQSNRYKAYIDQVRKSFPVVEDRNFSDSPRHLLVFSGSQ